MPLPCRCQPTTAIPTCVNSPPATSPIFAINWEYSISPTCRSDGFLILKSILLPIIGNSPKSDTHLQGRNNSADYYVFTLRRIIIWFTHRKSQKPYNASAIHTTEHFILLSEFNYYDTTQLRYKSTLTQHTRSIYGKPLRLNLSPKPRHLLCR